MSKELEERLRNDWDTHAGRLLMEEAADTLKRQREAIFKIDREANGNRKDKAARISAIARKVLQETGSDT